MATEPAFVGDGVITLGDSIGEAVGSLDSVGAV